MFFFQMHDDAMRENCARGRLECGRGELSSDASRQPPRQTIQKGSTSSFLDHPSSSSL